MGEACVILKCNTCSTRPHSQDQLHGMGNRVHNIKMSGQYCCTVCNTIRGEAKTDKEDKKRK